MPVIMRQKILAEFQESIRVKESFIRDNAENIAEVAKVIAGAFSEGKKVILFGNGGSSTDASHICAELVGRYKKERPGLPAIALNTDMAIMTAVSNDYDFSEIFSRQVKALASEGDVVMAFSTSGSSPNIIKAVDAAKRKNLKIIAFTGSKGQKFAQKAHHAFVVPSANTPRIQETHITIGHVLCQMVEEILFEEPRKK
jgi:D-sedoheptulose 7-phosphate isomerase